MRGDELLPINPQAEPCVEPPCAPYPVSSLIGKAMKFAPGDHGESQSSERGSRAGELHSVTHAVAMMGKIEVQPPYDWFFGDNFFTAEGKATLAELMEDPCLAVEHWAPECTPHYSPVRNGRQIRGPQPVRDARRVWAFRGSRRKRKRESAAPTKWC